MKRIMIILLILITMFGLVGCNPTEQNNPKYGVRTVYLDSAFSIVPFIHIVDLEENIKDVVEVRAAMNQVVQDLNNTYSIFLGNSLITQINEQAGIAPVEVDDEFIYIMKQSIEVSELSIVDGIALYDVTILPVWNTWDFSNKYYDYFIDNIETIPTQQQIDAKLPLVDYTKIIIDEENNTIFLSDKGMEIDLGSIIKGYACDKIKDVLLEFGYSRAVINVGGNIMTMGHNRGENEDVPWKIQIQTPYITPFHTNYDRLKAIGWFFDTNITVVSSGVYERYIVTEDDEEHHHILDPRNGYPIDNDLLAVTIVTQISSMADALSTAIFALGFEEGLAVVETLEGVEAIFILRSKEIYVSSGLYGRFEFNENVTARGYEYKGVSNGTSN